MVAGAGVKVTREGRRLVRRNQGLLLFAEQDYKGALSAMQKASKHRLLHVQACCRLLLRHPGSLQVSWLRALQPLHKAPLTTMSVLQRDHDMGGQVQDDREIA